MKCALTTAGTVLPRHDGFIVLCATQIVKGYEGSKGGTGNGADELWPYMFLYQGRGIPGAKSDVRLRKE